MLVDDTGGGVCQTSSTIYYACLRANLEITERYAHRYVPAYIDWGMDATVSWGGPDYKFTNNTDYPIKIVATYSGGLLFPYPAALAVNLTGTAVAQTLPFLLGRWNRQWAAGVLSRFPTAERFLSEEQDREGLLVFLLRLAGASPGDLVSLALGAAGIPPSRYLVPGVLGAAPRVAAATLLGAALWDPWSRRFWISVGINAAITGLSLTIWHFRRRIHPPH